MGVKLEASDFSSNDNSIGLNDSFEANSTTDQYVGFRVDGDSSNAFEGEMADVHLVDGQALDGDSFGKDQDGTWVRQSYSGDHGTNGFHLDFEDADNLGNDASSNGNNLTANGDPDQIIMNDPGEGTDGNDVIIGNDKLSTLDGGAGDDLLVAGDVIGGEEALSSIGMSGGTSDYLTTTLAAEGNRTTWTFSSWVKRDSISDLNGHIFGSGPNLSNTSNSTMSYIRFDSDNHLSVYDYDQGLQGHVRTEMAFTDNDWHHITVAYDTTQDNPEDRVKFYVDGVEVGKEAGSQYPDEDFEGYFNTSQIHMIGRYSGGAGDRMFNGELARTEFVDGQALGAAAFGQEVGGEWSPSEYDGSYGDNGFHLDYSDGTNTGVDASGNGNDFGINGTLSHMAESGLNLPLPGGAMLNGGSGDDTLIGGAGDDTLVGGSGADVARYAGSMADYTITNNGDGSYSVSNSKNSQAGDIGKDMLSGIETVEFDDNGTVTSIDLTEESGPVGSDAKVVLAAWEAVTHKLTVTDADLLEADTTEVLTYSIDGLEADGNGVYTLASGATVTFDADGNYTYNPAASGQPTNDSFTWRATDTSGLSTKGTVKLSAGPEALYGIGHSVSIDGDAGRLNWTPVGNADRTKWTLSGWVKLDGTNEAQMIYSLDRGNHANNSDMFYIGFTADGNFRIYEIQNASPSVLELNLKTEQTWDETEGWINYHIEMDTSQSDPSQRVRLWMNGVAVSNYAEELYPDHHAQMGLGMDETMTIGREDTRNRNPLQGELAEMRYLDGVTHGGPEAAGLGHFEDGAWVPDAYEGDYGANGYHLDFADSNAFATDRSGQGNSGSFTISGSLNEGTDTPTTGLDLSGVDYTATDGNDMLKGGSRTATLDGGAGDDLIEAGDVIGGEEALSSIGMSGGTSDYMTTTLEAEGNRTTWTFSSWVKRDSISDLNGHIFGSGPNLSNTSNSTMSYIRFDSDNHLSVYDYDQGVQGHVRTEMAFTDNDWHHITVAYDTTQDNPEDRVKFYVDGVEVGKEAGSQYPDPDFEGYFNTSQIHMIGRYSGGGGQPHVQR